MHKKITIITVVYNGEKYIEDTIKSVISQKTDDMEYIIIDGASQDSTLDIIKKYEENIDIVISEKDGGIYDAMNKGLKFATGDYVAFLNSDDFYLSNVVDSVLYKIKENPDVILIDTLIQDEDNRRKKFIRELNVQKFKLRLRIPFMHPSAFIKKEHIDYLNGFDLRYRIAADCDLLLKIIKRKPKVSHSDACIVMRLGGISDKNYRKGRIEYRKIYSEYSGNIFEAWIGYFESMLEFYIGKLFKVIK